MEADAVRITEHHQTFLVLWVVRLRRRGKAREFDGVRGPYRRSSPRWRPAMACWDAFGSLIAAWPAPPTWRSEPSTLLPHPAPGRLQSGAAARWFCCRIRTICRFTSARSSRFFARRAMRAVKRSSAVSMRLLNLSWIACSLPRQSSERHKLTLSPVSGWLVSLTSNQFS
jgi:hypothetical protein